MKKKNKIILIVIPFVIIGLVGTFGLRNILGLPIPEEKVRKNKIVCKDSVYIVDDNQYAIRYKGYANKVLIVEYENKIINCGVDYIIKDIWIKE